MLEVPHITKTERALLNALADRPEGVSTRELYDAHGGEEGMNSGNLVAVHIKNLRRKLPHTARIDTIRGYGYLLFVQTAA